MSPVSLKKTLQCRINREKPVNRAVISMQYRRVTPTHETNRQADRHTTTAHTALAWRRAVKTSRARVVRGRAIQSTDQAADNLAEERRGAVVAGGVQRRQSVIHASTAIPCDGRNDAITIKLSVAGRLLPLHTRLPYRRILDRQQPIQIGRQ